MICIFSPEFGLKPRYGAFHVTENGKVFENIVPPFIRDHIDSVDCTIGFKDTVTVVRRLTFFAIYVNFVADGGIRVSLTHV